MIDLDAYLARIGHHGARDATLAVLEAVCAAHPAAIPFENLDAFLGTVPRLDLASLETKLVGRRRGGWCYEQNALLQHALAAMGFRVTALAARVAWGAAPDAPLRPRTHMLLRVDLPGDGAWLVDAGFGGHLLDRPLRMSPGIEQATPSATLRLHEADGMTTLETRLPAGWMPVYRYTPDAQRPVDYEPLNWYTATHPTAMLRHNLVLERLEGGARTSLVNDRLVVRVPGAAPDQRRIGSADELAQVLDERYGLDLPLPAAALWERVPRGYDGIHVPTDRSP